MKNNHENAAAEKSEVQKDEHKEVLAVQPVADTETEGADSLTENTQNVSKESPESDTLTSGTPLPEAPVTPPAFVPAASQRQRSHPATATAQNGPRKYQKKRSKKPIIIFSVLGVLILVGVGLWFGVFKDMLEMQNADPVYVNSVGVITGVDLSGTPKFAGVVEPQKTVSVNKDSTKEVKELYVKAGDPVEKGSKLFTYDTSKIQLDLDTAKLDLTGIENKITETKKQITDLEKDRDKANSEDKLGYTLQIQTLELNIKQEDINLAAKKKEIENLENSIGNVDVLAEEAGVVKAVNENGGSDNMGNALPYISILKTGDFRVKGTISEQTYNYISVGQSVTVQSRVNPEQSWNGVVDSVDKESSSDNNNMEYWSGSQQETSSKFNFYVTLDTLDGLILGQHVYIEPFTGENQKKEGLWLPAYFIDTEGSYVWARDSKEKLEKREISLGEYDGETDTYQILSGLTVDDYIAFPDDTLKPGMPTTVQESSFENGGSNGVYYPGTAEGGSGDGVYYDEKGNVIGGAEGEVILPEGDAEPADPDSGNYVGNDEDNGIASGNDSQGGDTVPTVPTDPSGGNMEPRVQELVPSSGNMGVLG